MLKSHPRKRFQIHLSTALTIMFAVGGFIFANLQPRGINLRGLAEFKRIGKDWPASFYGWPLKTVVIPFNGPGDNHYPHIVNVWYGIFDITVLVAVILLIYLFSERWKFAGDTPAPDTKSQ